MPDPTVQLADEFRRALLKRERKAAVRMVEAYGRIWNRLAKNLAILNQEIAAARARNEIINQSWLYRQRRFGDLLRQVDAEFKRFEAIAETTITKQQEIAATNGLNHSFTLMTTAAESAGIAVTFNKLPTSAVENMVGFLSNGAPLRTLLDQLPREARQIVEQGLIEGVALGKNPTAIARVIRRGLGGNLHRALTISRTEVLRAYRTASIQNYQANSDVVSGWYWRSARSRRTCAACIALDGTFWPVSKPMRPHPRCIPAGATIHAPDVQASTARWYEGELFEFATVGGYRLSVTPNHPILSSKGWIAAGLLNEGDEIVSARFPERVIAAVNPNNSQIPARIEEIFRASSKEGGMSSARMPTAPEDFHGDGIGSNVHVVNMHGLLGNGLQASLGEPLRHQDFIGRSVQLLTLAGDSSLNLLFDGVVSDASDSMGGLGVTAVLFRCASGHHQAVSLEAGSSLNPVFEQYASDDIARDSEAISDGFLGFPRSIPVADVTFRQDGFASNPALFQMGRFQDAPLFGVTPESTGFEFRSHGSVGGFESLGDVLAAFPGNVGLDRILKISRSDFSGQVYNLQTSTGWYISNGIITHNCRCTLIPGVKGVKVDKGTTWFNKQDAETQHEIIGTDIGYKAFKDGDLTLKDFVGLQRSFMWGESYFQLSVKRALRGEGQFPE